MTCSLQGRYAGVRDPCRLGIRPSVDQVQSSPDQRGKREKKQRKPRVLAKHIPLILRVSFSTFGLETYLSLKFCLFGSFWFFFFFLYTTFQ